MATAANGEETVVPNGDLSICPVCQEEYNSPKLLPCLHSFCESCLANSLEQSNIMEGQAFLCPLCRTECVVPQRGVSALKTNILILTLQEFQERKSIHPDQICDACDSQAPPRKKCVECNDWLCGQCVSMHGKVKVTRDHSLMSIEDLQSGKHDDFIKDTFEPLMCSKHGEPLKLYCTQQGCQAPICTVCKTTAGHDGHMAIELTEQAIKDGHVLADLMRNTQKVINTTTVKINNLKQEEKATSSIRKRTHKAINDRMEEVIERVVKQLGEYAEGLHQEVEKMVKGHKKELETEKNESKFKLQAMLTAQKFSKTVLDFGRTEELVALSKDIRERLMAFQKPPDVAPPGWRQPRLHPAAEMEPDDVANLFGNLTFEGEIVKTNVVKSFNCKLDHEDRDCALCDVAIDEADNIVTVDRDNRNIKVFTQNGALVMEEGVDFRSPNRLTILKSSGMFLVKDEKLLKLVNKDGSFAGIFAEELQQPVGLCQTKDGEILITEWVTGSIHGFSENGDHMRSFECNCEAAGYVASANNGNVIVSDWKRHSIKIFDNAGRFINQYGSHGAGAKNGQLDHPYGVCSDKYGHILIADTWNNRIVLLSERGGFLKYLLTKENGLNWPQAIAISKEGNLIIAEQHGNIKIFQYMA